MAKSKPSKKHFEKIIYNHLIDFMDHNDILYGYQFGFRKGHSTQQAIITFLTIRSHFVRLPGAISGDSPVLSGVPQGTVLGQLLFLIMLADINKDISESNLKSFADDTQIYTKIYDVTDCNTLQQDLNHEYHWASANNMFLMPKSFIMFPSVLINILVCQMCI